jgi:hypothetical protein
MLSVGGAINKKDKENYNFKRLHSMDEIQRQGRNWDHDRYSGAHC